MLRFKPLLLATAAAAIVFSSFPATAEAGPLLDWLRNRCRRPCAPQCFPQPQVVQSPCTTTCMQTCSRVVVNYVPYTAYRCNWERVPVTTYRPVTNTDPCTGCTVTCQRPCTTYSWRMRQVPYTTYRPVYRTETYQRPVTYTSYQPTMVQQPAVIQPSTCNTCTTGFAGTPVVQTPVNVPNGTLSTGGTYSTPQSVITTPADSQPTLNPETMQKPIIIDRRDP